MKKPVASFLGHMRPDSDPLLTGLSFGSAQILVDRCLITVPVRKAFPDELQIEIFSPGEHPCVFPTLRIDRHRFYLQRSVRGRFSEKAAGHFPDFLVPDRANNSVQPHRLYSISPVEHNGFAVLYTNEPGTPPKGRNRSAWAITQVPVLAPVVSGGLIAVVDVAVARATSSGMSRVGVNQPTNKG